MRRRIIFGVAAVCLAVAGVVFLLSPRDGKRRSSASASSTLTQQKTSAPNAKLSQKKERDNKKARSLDKGDKSVADTAKRSKKRAMRFGEVTPSDMNADDSAAVTAKLDDLLDDEDYDAVLREAVRLKTHPDAEVRSRVLLALHWTGLKGLGDLTGMLKDPDPDVAKEAMDYWKMALSEVENSADKAELLTAAAAVLGGDMPDETFNDLLPEINTLEEADAVPALLSLLRQTEDADQITEIIGTLDTIVNSDTPMETKDDAEKAAQEWSKAQTSGESDETAGGILRRNIRKPSAPKK